MPWSARMVSLVRWISIRSHPDLACFPQPWKSNLADSIRKKWVSIWAYGRATRKSSGKIRLRMKKVRNTSRKKSRYIKKFMQKNEKLSSGRTFRFRVRQSKNWHASMRTSNNVMRTCMIPISLWIKSWCKKVLKSYPMNSKPKSCWRIAPRFRYPQKEKWRSRFWQKVKMSQSTKRQGSPINW